MESSSQSIENMIHIENTYIPLFTAHIELYIRNTSNRHDFFMTI